jgi:hypothetical protein
MVKARKTISAMSGRSMNRWRTMGKQPRSTAAAMTGAQDAIRRRRARERRVLEEHPESEGDGGRLEEDDAGEAARTEDEVEHDVEEPFRVVSRQAPAGKDENFVGGAAPRLSTIRRPRARCVQVSGSSTLVTASTNAAAATRVRAIHWAAATRGPDAGSRAAAYSRSMMVPIPCPKPMHIV